MSAGPTADTLGRWLRDGVARAWGLDPRRTSLVPRPFTEGRTCVLTVDGARAAVVRLQPLRTGAERAALESEVAWVSAIARGGVAHVPALLTPPGGAPVTVLRDPAGGDWAAAAYADVPGTGLDAVADPLAHYAALGATTARLHEFALGWEPPAGFRRRAWGLADLAADAGGGWERAPLSAVEERLLGTAQEAVLDVLARVTTPRGQARPDWGLIHADLGPANVVVDAGGLTLVGFEDCSYTWLLYDFAASVLAPGRADAAQAYAARWVEGYASVRPLTVPDEAVASALVVVRALQLLGRAGLGAQTEVAKATAVHVALRYLHSTRWPFE